MTGGRPVLVAGASGFIGRHLCRHLLAGDRPVRRFSRSVTAPPSFCVGEGKRLRSAASRAAVTARSYAPRLERSVVAESPATAHSPTRFRDFARNDGFVRGDILDPEALRAACEDVGVVFHLAGAARTADRRNPLAMKTNVEGTRNLLAAARAAGARRLVFVSSALAAEFDHGQSPARPGDYARGKWEAERLVLEANGADGLLTTVLRPAPVYGAGMKGGIARMIRLIHARRLPPLPKLDRGFSLAGVDDVCRAAILASESPLAPGQCWLLTDLQRYTANAVEQAVYDALGRKKPGWRTPAVVFFAASAMLQLGRLAGWKQAESGLQTWRNLTSERTWQARDIFEELDFRPSGDLYEQLPEIIRELTGQQPAPRE